MTPRRGRRPELQTVTNDTGAATRCAQDFVFAYPALSEVAKLCRPAALAKNVPVRMTSVPLALAPAFGRFGFVLCAHVVHGWLKLVRIANTVQENQAGIRPWEAAEIPLGLGRRRSPEIANLWDHAGELEGVHAATGERRVRKIQKPKTIMAVFDHVRGDNGPLPRVGGPR